KHLHGNVREAGRGGSMRRLLDLGEARRIAEPGGACLIRLEADRPTQARYGVERALQLKRQQISMGGKRTEKERCESGERERVAWRAGLQRVGERRRAGSESFSFALGALGRWGALGRPLDSGGFGSQEL